MISPYVASSESAPVTIIGVDEAGTGAWAGPVTVGVCATPTVAPFFWPEIRDSKQVSVTDREWLFNLIKQELVPWAVGMATAGEVDAVGLTAAKRIAAKLAIKSLLNKYPNHPLQRARTIVFDGQNCFGLSHKDFPTLGRTSWQHMIKADMAIKEVGAASICAKYVRDFWMRAAAKTYPGYGFEEHVGYGVPQHKEALERLGLCDLHRMTVKPVAAVLEAGRVAPGGKRWLTSSE